MGSKGKNTSFDIRQLVILYREKGKIISRNFKSLNKHLHCSGHNEKI